MNVTAAASRSVIISGYHDYRSKRRVNLHFIADELTRSGTVFFLSLRYSWLTRLAEDPRHDLWNRSNHVELVGGVGCYLWKTLIHACRLPAWLAPIERLMFGIFASYLPREARDAIMVADIIFIESGIALIYLPLIRRLNDRAKVVYLASDSLSAINQAKSIEAALRDYAQLIDSARLPSPWLRDEIPHSIPCYFVPHGIEKARFSQVTPSPYAAESRNVVSVGSMLFDAEFFRRAAALFPDLTFHVIGSGHASPIAPNVVLHPEMPFEATLPYIKHADVAVAAYGEGVAPYLTHTSMKLMQYAYLGIPALCPDIVAGDMPGRFGYRSGDDASIRAAMNAALRSGKFAPQQQLAWRDVARRWMDPTSFPDTDMSGCVSAPPPDHAQSAA